MTELVIVFRNFSKSDKIKEKNTLPRTHEFSQEDIFTAATFIAGFVITATGGA